MVTPSILEDDKEELATERTGDDPSDLDSQYFDEFGTFDDAASRVNWDRANDRLKLVEDLLAKHKRNRRIAIAILTITLVILFGAEINYCKRG